MPSARQRNSGELKRFGGVAVAVLFAVLLFTGLRGSVALIGFLWAHLD